MSKKDDDAIFLVSLIMDFALRRCPDEPELEALRIVDAMNKGDSALVEELKNYAKESFKKYTKEGNDFEL